MPNQERIIYFQLSINTFCLPVHHHGSDLSEWVREKEKKGIVVFKFVKSKRAKIYEREMVNDPATSVWSLRSASTVVVAAFTFASNFAAALVS